MEYKQQQTSTTKLPLKGEESRMLSLFVFRYAIWFMNIRKSCWGDSKHHQQNKIDCRILSVPTLLQIVLNTVHKIMYILTEHNRETFGINLLKRY